MRQLMDVCLDLCNHKAYPTLVVRDSVSSLSIYLSIYLSSYLYIYIYIYIYKYISLLRSRNMVISLCHVIGARSAKGRDRNIHLRISYVASEMAASSGSGLSPADRITLYYRRHFEAGPATAPAGPLRAQNCMRKDSGSSVFHLL